MAATAAVEDDESWLYGESIQEEKTENEESERHISDGAEDTSNQDESSRVSRFSSDDPPTIAGKQDRSNDAASPTPSSDLPKRTLDDKEAGELSGEEENAAAPPPVKESVETNENADGAEGTEGGVGDEAEAAPPGTAGSDESDSDDDSVQVTIGDIKAGPPAYGYSGPPVNLNIKRGGVYQTSGVGGQSTGKGKGVDLESVGMINGVPTYEFNLDSMEDKPWRKPGADITDYFNYGFNEDTWKAYCEKQRKLRLEANGTIGGLAVGNKTHHTAKDQQIPVATVNENSKYAGALGKKAGPPPGRKISGSIDVIGASTTTSRRAALTAPKENVIQVVTADKREYSRKPFIDTNMPPPPPGVIPPGLPIFPDLSMPPPGMPPPGMPPPGIPPPNMPMLPGVMPTFGEPFDAYNRSYPPPPGVPLDRPPPGFDNSFDGSYFNGSNSGQDPYNPFEPTGDGPWESRDGPSSRYHKKDWDYHGRPNDRSPQRSPNDDEYEQRRHREYRERDRDRSRDRDRDRERERHSESRHSESRHSESRRSESRHKDRERDRESRTRDYESEERRERDRSERGESERRHREHRDRDEKHSRSSRRKHREETDEATEHRSSRHKRKRAKREKEEEASVAAATAAGGTGGASSAGGAASEANESQEATAENQDDDSQPE